MTLLSGTPTVPGGSVTLRLYSLLSATRPTMNIKHRHGFTLVNQRHETSGGWIVDVIAPTDKDAPLEAQPVETFKGRTHILARRGASSWIDDLVYEYKGYTITTWPCPEDDFWVGIVETPEGNRIVGQDISIDGDNAGIVNQIAKNLVDDHANPNARNFSEEKDTINLVLRNLTDILTHIENCSTHYEGSGTLDANFVEERVQEARDIINEALGRKAETVEVEVAWEQYEHREGGQSDGTLMAAAESGVTTVTLPEDYQDKPSGPGSQWDDLKEAIRAEEGIQYVDQFIIMGEE